MKGFQQSVTLAYIYINKHGKV